MARSTLTLPQAIGAIEGFGAKPTNRPTRLNNPGDIDFAPWNAVPPFNAQLEQTIAPEKPRFAHFPTAAQGWAALEHLLLTDSYRSLTIEQAINRYAPPVENNTVNYVSVVCRLVGCAPDDIVEKVITAPAEPTITVQASASDAQDIYNDFTDAIEGLGGLHLAPLSGVQLQVDVAGALHQVVSSDIQWTSDEHGKRIDSITLMTS